MLRGIVIIIILCIFSGEFHTRILNKSLKVAQKTQPSVIEDLFIEPLMAAVTTSRTQLGDKRGPSRADWFPQHMVNL